MMLMQSITDATVRVRHQGDASPQGHAVSCGVELMLLSPEDLRRQLMNARERIVELEKENQDLKHLLMKALVPK